MVDARTLRLRISPPIYTGRFRRGRDYDCVRPAGTRDWLFFCTVAGAGQLRFAHADPLLLTPGTLACYVPGAQQDYRTDPHTGIWSFIWAHVDADPRWAPWLRWPEPRPGLRLVALEDPTWSAVAAACARAHAHATGPYRHRDDLAMNALEEAILLAHGVAGMAGGAGPLVAIAQEVCAHLARPWSVAAMAREAGLSVSRFSRSFRAAMGVPPNRFLERERLRRARVLLESTDLPVAEIGRQVGYLDPAYFSARFRAGCGVSAIGWRRSRRGAGR